VGEEGGERRREATVTFTGIAFPKKSYDFLTNSPRFLRRNRKRERASERKEEREREREREALHTSCTQQHRIRYWWLMIRSKQRKHPPTARCNCDYNVTLRKFARFIKMAASPTLLSPRLLGYLLFITSASYPRARKRLALRPAKMNRVCVSRQINISLINAFHVHLGYVTQNTPEYKY